MFTGFETLGNTLTGALMTKDGSGTPTNAGSLPTFRVYGPSSGVYGLRVTGTAAFLDTASITGATNASPIVITSASHGLSTGDRVTITGVGGNNAANGTFTITKVNANSFSLDGSTGNGAYTSGGTWNLTGAYKYTVAATAGNGFEAGENYHVVFTFAVGGTNKGDLQSFTVT